MTMPTREEILRCLHNDGFLDGVEYLEAGMDMLRRIADALDGCVVVPKEPTSEMLIEARNWSYNKYGKPIGNDAAIGCWAAMLAAAHRGDVS